MTKSAGRARGISEANTARRLAMQRERESLIRQGLLPKNRMIPGSSKNHRIGIDKFQEMETIKKNREQW